MTDSPGTLAGDCGNCALLSRRGFVAQSALAVLGTAVVAACGDGEIGGPLGPGRQLPPGFLVVTIADFPALADIGGIARVDPGTSQPVAVTRTGPVTFLAHSMICPHAGYQPIQIAMGAFRCPNHGAQFAADGHWIGGQRTRDLTRFTTAYDPGSGTLTIS